MDIGKDNDALAGDCIGVRAGTAAFLANWIWPTWLYCITIKKGPCLWAGQDTYTPCPQRGGFNPHIKAFSLGTVLPGGPVGGTRVFSNLELMADMGGEGFVKRLNPCAPPVALWCSRRVDTLPPSAPSLLGVVNARPATPSKGQKLDEAVLRSATGAHAQT